VNIGLLVSQRDVVLEAYSMTMKLDMVEVRKTLIRVLAYLEVRRWIHTLEFGKLSIGF